MYTNGTVTFDHEKVLDMKHVDLAITFPNYHDMEREIATMRKAADDYTEEHFPGYEVYDFETYFNRADHDKDTITYTVAFTARPIDR